MAVLCRAWGGFSTEIETRAIYSQIDNEYKSRMGRLLNGDGNPVKR